ncbi:tyrosine-type recombinase/integrase [Novosphingobium aquimarinum]|uniref:tyrosine-type recombinase/integrase n=1 Tax=Novosphingobium aquimarinum TaxID=2682494 RepID=UPI0012EC086E|nr:integrase arm-type DNA-binding domain-containing protein [Novosphingobium aquimarinum]
MLTQAAAKAAVPRDRAFKLADFGGLFLFVAPTGTKSWRLKYRRGGKERLLVLGRFPEISLPDARKRREEAKAQLRAGLDPATPRELLETFEQLARAWYRHAEAGWSRAHAEDVIAALERDVFPAIGDRQATTIEPPELLDVLGTLEARGRIETARRMRQRLSAIFGFGIAKGLLERDPAHHLRRAMQAAAPTRPMPALTRIEDCRALLAACDRADARAATRLASRFLALTAVRLEAVRGMRWEELEDLDGAEPLWRVPAARMKLKRAKKNDARFDHLVPLSREALSVLRAAGELGVDPKLVRREPHEDGHDTHSFVFAGRSGIAPIGEGAIGALYARAGFAGRHVPHGWRSSFSTILNETLGPDARDDIDRALAHSPGSKVEAAYNRAAQLNRRRVLFERWGAMLMT